jgi:CheY-like chemotaxis protein
MTMGKRALIVDDSRSARVILSRMLEQHGLAVDTAESAEQALEYLQQGRPDVIFMDHLMPGMDGFQAVQAIKGDAQTATIPLMMYTSQEGELYVSQARALGAIGVLPKTVRPADVSRVLYQLHLLPDRRQQRSALFAGQAANAALAEPVAAAEARAIEPGEAPPPVAIPALAISELQGSLRQSIQQLVRDQLAEQRRFMLATFEAFARRLGTEIRETASKASPPVAVAERLSVPQPPRQWWPVVLTALLAVLPAVILGVLYWRALGANDEFSRQLAGVRAAVEKAARAAPRPAVTAVPVPVSGPTAPSAAPIAVEFVPYGETPLANARLDRLRSLAAALEAQQFRGHLVAESYVGDFCLAGNPAEGFAVAPPDSSLQKCDLVGNPFDDTLSPAQRQSLDFANFAATLRQRTRGAIDVVAVSAGRRNPIAYPEQTESSTAGGWNAVAAQNNRVEFRVVPATALAAGSTE